MKKETEGLTTATQDQVLPTRRRKIRIENLVGWNTNECPEKKQYFTSSVNAESLRSVTIKSDTAKLSRKFTKISARNFNGHMQKAGLTVWQEK